MQKSLSQEFNKTAAAARGAFPDALKRLVVLLVPISDTPVYVAPAVAEQLTQNVSHVKRAVAGWADWLQKNNAVGVASRHQYVAGTQVNLIALKDNLQGVFYSGYTREMWSVYVLDHELGHHVTEHGLDHYSGQMMESSADAYATLRHIQRFGKNTPFAGDNANRVAKSLLLHDDPAHYTTDAIQRAIQVAAETDISKLSLQEIAALAGKIADEAHLDGATLEKVYKAYLPVNRACREQIGDASAVTDKLYARDSAAYKLFCRETLAVMRNHTDDADIFKAGKRFLNYSPVRKFMQRQAKTDTFYKDALGFLKAGMPVQDNRPGNVSPTPRVRFII